MYNKWVFIFINIALFFFNYILITIIPNPIIYGIPLQLWCYLLMGPVVAIVWASYFFPFFKTQKDR